MEVSKRFETYDYVGKTVRKLLEEAVRRVDQTIHKKTPQDNPRGRQNSQKKRDRLLYSSITSAFLR
jgi:hypothetical protein